MTYFPTSDFTHLRPREKIMHRGVETLSLEELFTVILGSGSTKLPVEHLAKKISQTFLDLNKVELSDLLSIKGVGLAKASQILAAIELVERLRPSGSPIMDSVQQVLTQVGELRYADREQLLCLYLNARMQLILREILAIGNMNQIGIVPRDIFTTIKHHPIHFIILAHNHPTGVAIPSEEDKKFTQRIAEAGQILGIELLDHLIVARSEHFSFKEQKLM